MNMLLAAIVQAVPGRSWLPCSFCCSLFELDLHGLHASEAVAALDRRLDLLQGILRDAALQPQDLARAGAGAAGTAKMGGGRGQAARIACGWNPRGPAGQAAPPEAAGLPMLPAGAAGRSVLPAGAGGRWELRVIVGRGAHSSGGEASIPRAVEARLAALGYQFIMRTGALDVQLRRAFGTRKAIAVSRW
jgi:hypothetical protein